VVGPYRLHALGGAASETPGTFKGFMAAHGVPASYTLEAPGTIDPKRQLRGMMVLLRSLLSNAERYGPRAAKDVDR
jgi:hypothetical protein